MTTAIQDQLKSLVQLQAVDTQIYRLKKELEAYPRSRKKLDEDLEIHKITLQSIEAALKDLQKSQKEKELELDTKEEKIRKLQSQLYQLKSNKEYATMELEIRGLKADKSVLEEEGIRFLDAVDQQKSKVAAEKERLLAEEKKFEASLAQLGQAKQATEAQWKALEQERARFLPSVDPKLMAQYERILKSREGLALAPVKNGSCGGCHLGLPPQVVNEIQMAHKLIVCESCARILYWMS